MKATNILWDVDDKEDLASLPTEIVIPPDLENAGNDVISDYLSDTVGCCHFGFRLTK